MWQFSHWGIGKVQPANAKAPIPDTRYPIPDTRYLIPDTRYHGIGNAPTLVLDLIPRYHLTSAWMVSKNVHIMWSHNFYFEEV